MHENNCGQTCVAMILNRTQDGVAERIGRGKTSWADLQSILRQRMKHRPLRVTRGSGLSWGNLMICRVRSVHRSKESHFIVIQKAEVFDPALKNSMSFDEWKKLRSDCRISTFVCVKPKIQVESCTAENKLSGKAILDETKTW